MAVKSNFAVGQVLTASDVNTYLTNGGLVYVNSYTLSGGTTDMTSIFSATYDVYKIVIYELNASADLEVGFRMLSGSTPASGAGTYSVQRLNIGSTSVTAARAAQTYGRVGYCDGTAAYISGYMLEVFSPFSAAYTNIQAGFSYADSATGANIEFNTTLHTVATSYDGMQVYMPTGTIDGGKAIVYGYRKA